MGLGGAVITDESAAEVGTYVLTAEPSVDDDPVFSVLPSSSTRSSGTRIAPLSCRPVPRTSPVQRSVRTRHLHRRHPGIRHSVPSGADME